MAEHADDGFLLYLIDMAIIEANAKARARNDGLETPVAGPLRHDDSISPWLGQRLEVVR